MLYQTNRDLPTSIRDRFSESAQDLYRIAFNSAIQWSGEETKAHHSALSAIRSQTASLNSIIG